MTKHTDETTHNILWQAEYWTSIDVHILTPQNL